MIKVKRVYEEPSSEDGYRVLVDRLWPRGLSKDRAKIDLWLRDIAPSNELRKWFGHDPKKWSEFQQRYQNELKDNSATQELKEIVKNHRNVTLIFGARDTEHNDAVVLKDLLEKEKMEGPS